MFDLYIILLKGPRGRYRMVVGFMQPLRQSLPIITNVVSSTPVRGEVYSIHHYVIKFVTDLWQFDGFLWVLRFPPQIKLIPRYN